MSPVLKPGDPEYEQMVSDMKTAQEGYLGSAKIEFKAEPLKYGQVEWAVIELTDALSKIVFHFVGIPRSMMIELSKFFMNEVRGKLVTDADEEAQIEAGENPIYRSNWDVMIYNINKYKATSLTNTIVRRIMKEFGG